MSKTTKEIALPPFVSMNDIYEDENGEPRYEEFDTQELGRRIEHDLLQLPEFLPPHTTVEKPARILSYNVIPEPDEDGMFTAILDFLPGDKVEAYLKKSMDTDNNKMDTQTKNFSISNEQDICDLGNWLHEFIREYQQTSKRTLYTTNVEKLPPVTFNVEVKITRQASNGTSVQR